ncbi:hypothetical protein BDZ88DRAFT_437129 [Geranomyces variabilis]|nr:hypothetical protein BDZ88DRAFT_437129 [Geranomyces variabilis]
MAKKGGKDNKKAAEAKEKLRILSKYRRPPQPKRPHKYKHEACQEDLAGLATEHKLYFRNYAKRKEKRGNFEILSSRKLIINAMFFRETDEKEDNEDEEEEEEDTDDDDPLSGGPGSASPRRRRSAGWSSCPPAASSYGVAETQKLAMFSCNSEAEDCVARCRNALTTSSTAVTFDESQR